VKQEAQRSDRAGKSARRTRGLSGRLILLLHRNNASRRPPCPQLAAPWLAAEQAIRIYWHSLMLHATHHRFNGPPAKGV